MLVLAYQDQSLLGQWGCINLFLVSLIWERRAIPLYWSLLPKLGSSNFEEQTTNLQLVLPLFSEDKVIVLVNREFWEIDARILAIPQGCVFLLKTEEESLYRNRTFSLVTVRWIRNHAVEPLYIFKVKEWEKLSLLLDLMLLVSGKETQGPGRLMKRGLFSQI